MSAGLTVVVPAWNEETRLAVTVEEVVAAARRHLADFEVIIVDDGSTDGTPSVAARLAARFPCVLVVRHETNLGVGAAYYTGLSLAKFLYSRSSRRQRVPRIRPRRGVPCCRQGADGGDLSREPASRITRPAVALLHARCAS